MSTSTVSQRRPRSSPARVYLDTSAYLCVLLGEDGWEELSASTHGAELLSSVLLVLEAQRALVRLTRERRLSLEQHQVCIERLDADIKTFGLRDLTLELCRSAAMPAVATPRSLDLAHLRTALLFQGEGGLTGFLTTDRSQELAARELGLPV